jgi:hypothetical protein
MEEFYIVKTRKKLSLIMFIPYTKAQRIDESSGMFVAVVMVVLTMQSIGGNNNGTYTLYMFPLTSCALGLAC